MKKNLLYSSLLLALYGSLSTAAADNDNVLFGKYRAENIRITDFTNIFLLNGAERAVNLNNGSTMGTFDMGSDNYIITEGYSNEEGGGLKTTGNTALGINATIKSNSAELDGGGIYIDDGNLSFMTNGEVSSNQSITGSGGGIYLGNGTVDFASEGKIKDNQSVGAGGGVFILTGHLTVGINGEFSDNKSTGGAGGAAFLNEGNVTFNGEAKIIGNEAAGSGGAFYLTQGDVRFDSDATLTRNKSDRDGGAIYLEMGKAIFEDDVSINLNSAAGSGGALYLKEGDAEFGRDVTITNNSSAYRGGVINSDKGDITFGNNAHLSNNTSESEGGAIHSTLGDVTFGNGAILLSNESKSNHGGALALKEGDLKIGNDAQILNNIANTAGGVYISIGDAQIGSNLEVSKNISIAADGGGIHVRSGTVTIGANANMIENTAHFSGGALYVGKLILGNNAKFSTNIATLGSGGAILSYDGVVAPDGFTAENNTAGLHGGAIRSIGGMIQLSTATGDVEIKQNTAGQHGGGIFSSGNLIIGHAASTVNMQENTANGVFDPMNPAGGGAFFAGADANIYGKLALTNNATEASGGTGYIAGNLTIKGSGTISENRATDLGGAFFVEGSTSIETGQNDIIFKGNTHNTGTTSAANAIYFNNTASGAKVSLDADSGRSIRFFDPIENNETNGGIEVNINPLLGSGTVVFTGIDHSNDLDRTSNVSGSTTVHAGTMELAEGSRYGSTSAGNQFTVKQGATLRSSASSNSVKNAINATTIDIQGEVHLNSVDVQTFLLNGNVTNSGTMVLGQRATRAMGVAGNIVEISGNYVGNNGLIQFNTFLGDSNSPTDLLRVDNASGYTTVSINNVGGLGALTQGFGIKIVDVLGTSTPDAFKLGHTVIAGAYEYKLVNAGNNSWYLSSALHSPTIGPNPFMPWNPTPIYRPDVGINFANQESVTESMIPGFLGSSGPGGISGAGMMRADIRLNSGDEVGYGKHTGGKANTLWGFITGNSFKNKSLAGQIKYEADSISLYIGGDRTFLAGEDSLLVLGLMANALTVDTKSRNTITGSRADGSVDGYGVGAYATWFMKKDEMLSPFIDAYVIYGHYDNDVSTWNNPQSKYKSNAFSATLQGGYPIVITDTFAIEPQVQVTYVDFDVNNYQDHNGTKVSQGINNNIVGRIGIYGYGHGYKIKPYGALNLWYNDAQSHVKYQGVNPFVPSEMTTLASDAKRTVLEAKVGFQTQFSNDFTFWSEIGGRVGQQKYKDYNASIGLKYSW